MRLSASLAALALGAVSFFAAAVHGAAGGPRAGWTLRVELDQDVPTLDFGTAGFDQPSWTLAYETCRNLMSYPDKSGAAGGVPYPDGAASFPTVSRDGRAYTFRVRAGLRFQDGSALRAANYAAAITRDLDPKTSSPGTYLVQNVAQVRFSGNRLVVRLHEASSNILFWLGLPWFCPVPTNLPHDPSVVDRIPASGPYYIATHEPNRLLELRLNRFYRGRRLHRPERILITIGGDDQPRLRAIERGAADVDFARAPTGELHRLRRAYGRDRHRFYTEDLPATRLLALNSSRALFRGNSSLRRAVNFAVDRQALVRTLGYLRGRPTDQLLPPVVAGFRNVPIYPLRGPALAKARALARGHLRSRTAVMFTRDEPDALLRAQLVKQELSRIGIAVRIKTFSRSVFLEKITRRGAAFDIADYTWYADYPDPGDFIVPLVGEQGITARNASNVAYYRNDALARRLGSAARLFGSARYRAFRRLDILVTREDAPYVAYANPIAAFLVSRRLGCAVHQPVVRDLGAFCLRRG